MATAGMQPARTPHKTILQKLEDFWQKLTEGIALEQLWSNFKDEAHSTFRLYSADVERSGKLDNVSKHERGIETVKAFLWAVLMKLSPPRRVALFFGLVLLCIPSISFRNGRDVFVLDHSLFMFSAFLLVFAVLVAEVGDRVTMKRDLQIAREIQGWLVPAAAPEVPGYEFAFTMRPANTVAGDYYDVFYRPAKNGASERLVIVMADVAGKSMPAALLMAGFQASLRTIVDFQSGWQEGDGSQLVHLLDALNRHACQQSQEGRRFTTCFLAELEVATGVLTYVNAGHNSPVLLRSNAMERLESTAIPLGIQRDVQYTPRSLTLDAGDVLIMFTDGLAEAENAAGQEYGEPRLIPLMLPLRDRSANDLLKSVMSAIETYVGRAPQHDDMTCMVAKRK
jgi:serine phosphatase RsbU (regulator of sigma subunit)